MSQSRRRDKDNLMDWDSSKHCQGAQSQKKGQEDQGTLVHLGRSQWLFLGPHNSFTSPSGSGLPGNPSSYPILSSYCLSLAIGHFPWCLTFAYLTLTSSPRCITLHAVRYVNTSMGKIRPRPKRPSSAPLVLIKVGWKDTEAIRQVTTRIKGSITLSV